MPTVVIDPAGMTADLVLAEGERLATAGQALVFLNRHGVRHGLLNPALAALAGQAGPHVARVAVGEAPVPGRDGVTFYGFPITAEADGDAPPAPPATVAVGDVLARRHPARPGQEGRTVTGEVLPVPPVADPRLEAGAGAILSADGRQVEAVRAGAPHLRDGVVEVRPVARIAGDVDPAGPAIAVPGDLVVEGHVERPAGIEAAGDIFVFGGVQDTPMRAGGRIVVHGGVRRGARLVAGGEVHARFVESSAIEAGGRVLVREDAIRATIAAPRAVVGGAVVGGALALVEWLDVGDLGCEVAAPTEVAVVPPPPPADEHRAIARERRELADQALKLEILLDEQRRLAKDPRADGPREMVAKLAALILHLRERDAALAAQAAALPEPMPAARPYVRVRGTLHPGAAVQVGAQHMRPATAIPSATLREGPAAVAIEPALPTPERTHR